MNSPSCTIRSSGLFADGLRLPESAGLPGPGRARLIAAACLAAALLTGCGSSAPDALSEHNVAAVEDAQKPDKGTVEKGAGGLNFNYTNKSTFARLDIDLGSTDVYLEMSGRPAKPGDDATVEHGPQDKRPAPQQMAMTPEYPSQQQPPPDQNRMQEPQDRNRTQQAKRAKPETAPEEKSDDGGDDGQSNEDVTGKVLAGIRKAQELFYQKRYPEALQMVRQSLDAQSTAEGHALAGSICYMMGKNGLARRHWEDALRLNPDMPAVVNMLERTRTPGGRGSPSPRPLASRPAPRAVPAQVMEAAGPEDQAPFPEEMSKEAAPAPAAAPETVGNEDATGNREEAPAPQPAARPSTRHLAPTAAAPMSPAPAPTAATAPGPATAPKAKPAPAPAPKAAPKDDGAPANASEDEADAPADEAAPPEEDAAPKAPAKSPAAKPAPAVPAKNAKGK
jgi:hypothetical protein